MEKVVLAFSGGLDTSVCVKLLQDKYQKEVITACVDVGQPVDEISRPEKLARDMGVKHYTIDAKNEFAREFIFRAVKANALYEGYPLSTALARPLIAMKIVDLAKKEGATAISHGCTGKGNDQFRFESTIRSGSNCEVIAPIRDLNLTRTEEMEYAREHGIPLPSEKMYSIGVVTGVFQPIVANRKLMNVPNEGIYNWDPGALIGMYRPESFWMKQ
ncbi:MAG TPA: argininosuccinate synthase [Methanobacteriaceae archaeon]|nr:argininosuccinate synthase [Methanobacteriaceae archaeon]